MITAKSPACLIALPQHDKQPHVQTEKKNCNHYHHVTTTMITRVTITCQRSGSQPSSSDFLLNSTMTCVHGMRDAAATGYVHVRQRWLALERGQPAASPHREHSEREHQPSQHNAQACL
jgi:hypothetical protein